MFAPCLEGELAFGRFADVVAGCGAAVLRPGRASWAGLAGFWCTGRVGDGRADVPKPPADAGRGEPARRRGAFPGQAQVVGEWPGEPELSVDRFTDHPGRRTPHPGEPPPRRLPDRLTSRVGDVRHVKRGSGEDAWHGGWWSG